MFFCFEDAADVPPHMEQSQLDDDEEDDLLELDLLDEDDFFFVAYANATADAVVGAGQAHGCPFLSFP